MNSVHDQIRTHLLRSVGLDGPYIPVSDPDAPAFDLEKVYQVQWSPRFEKAMRNRLAMGHFRYGSFRCLPKYDHIASARRHLTQYVLTGNQEHLVDAANMCMAEQINPSCHPAPHFSAGDDTEHTRRIE